VFASHWRVASMPNANAIMNTTAATIAPPWNPPPGEPPPWKVTNSPYVSANGATIFTVGMMT